ncbi:MAG: hypothetical protein WBW88_15120 [Rhodothermales bacterium]
MFEDRRAIRSRTTPATPPEDAARRSLDYIRDTLERSSSFTAVPGWGNVMIGVVGLAAAVTASTAKTEGVWLAVWVGAAAVSIVIGAVTVTLKAMRIGIPVLGGPGRKFVFGLAPAFFAGALLTAVLYGGSLFHLLPAVWLLLYGAAIVTAGMNSIPLIRQLGLVFMFLGTAAFFTPAAWGNGLLAFGFGVCHIATGALIIRRYGG